MLATQHAIWSAVAALLSLVHIDALPVYDESDARLHLQYARASFCSLQSVQQWTCGSICEEAPIVNGSARVFKSQAVELQAGFSDASGYVAQLPAGPGLPFTGKCILAFRGSVDLMNYYHDFVFALTDWPNWPTTDKDMCPNCQVHMGVAQCYADLRKSMLYHIQELGCTSIAITGHSLGGAVATLASMELRGAGFPVAPVYTFGKLRVGTEAFVKAYIAIANQESADPPMWRVVNGHDPVPRLPPTWPLHYVHEPVEVYYPTEKPGNFKVCDSFGDVLEDPSCGISVTIENCLGNPARDHTEYLGLSVDKSALPSKCGAPEKPLWNV